MDWSNWAGSMWTGLTGQGPCRLHGLTGQGHVDWSNWAGSMWTGLTGQGPCGLV